MAGISSGSIYADLRIRLNNLEADFRNAKAKINSFVSDSKKTSQGFGDFWKNSFSTAFGFGAVQLVNKFFSSIKQSIMIFSGFQQSMQNVKSVTGAVGEEFRVMTQAAKDAGENTRFTARQAADALYYLGSAGFSASQSIAALDGVLQLAGATQSDLASTAESVASIISQYGLDASEATNISNVFAAAIGNSQATMEKLTNSFRQVGPVAAGFGYTVEETTGILQELYNAGFQGQAAGRALKSALADLASPTENIKTIFSKLGIELSKVNPETNSFADIIDVLGNSGASTADIIDAFGKVAGPQMAVLIKQGGDALRRYTDDVTGTNAAAEAYKIQNDSLAGSMDFLKSKLEGVAISIVEKFEPGLRDLIKAFINFLDATKPVGEFLGNIFNIILKFASISTNVITGLFNALLDGFKSNQTPMEKAGEGLTKVSEAIKKAGELGNTAKKLNQLTDEYDALSKKTNLTESEQGRLKTVISQIEKIMPSAVTKFDEYGNAIEISGEKSREAARQMLLAREATIQNALTQLKASESLYQRTVRQNEADAKAAKENRNRLISQSANAEARLAIIDEFRTKYQELVGDEDALIGPFAVIEKKKTSFNTVLSELEDRLKALGINFTELKGDLYSVQDPFELFERETRFANKTLNQLQKTLDKPTKSEQLYKDAKAKLDEIVELEKKLADIQNDIAGLDKDVKVPTIKDEIVKTWKDYLKGIEEATTEARLFGDEQDVLKARMDFLKESYLAAKEEGLDPLSAIMIKIREEYDRTKEALDELIQSEKDDLAVQERRQKISKDISDLIADYEKKLEDVGKSEKEKAIDLVKNMGASETATNAAIDAINRYWDAIGDDKAEKKKEEFRNLVYEIIASAQQLTDALTSLFSQLTDNRIDELDRQMDAELKAAGLSEETERERLEAQLEAAKEAGDEDKELETQKAIDRLDIEEKYEKEKAELQYKAAMNEWYIKLASATASLAQAIMVATAAAAWPANIPAITFATAQGVNVGVVAASKPQPPQFETGGISTGPKSGYPAILHGTEAVFNEDQMRNLFNIVASGGGSDQGNSEIAVTVIMKLESDVLGKAVAKTQNNGIIEFKPRSTY
jgi:TP901 family phage tail tape measure protein